MTTEQKIKNDELKERKLKLWKQCQALMDGDDALRHLYSEAPPHLLDLARSISGLGLEIADLDRQMRDLEGVPQPSGPLPLREFARCDC